LRSNGWGILGSCNAGLHVAIFAPGRLGEGFSRAKFLGNHSVFLNLFGYRILARQASWHSGVVVTINSTFVTRFLRLQGLCIFVSLVVSAIFWAIGQQINPFTIIVYSLCIGNLISFPLDRLSCHYAQHPFPYNWLIFLAFVFVLMLPVYTISTVIVWWIAPPIPISLWNLLTKGWKFPSLITLVFTVIGFLYNTTKDRLERRNVELQKSVELGAARLEMQDRELQRAREIQESLLPKDIPQLLGFALAAAWHPARAVGGDYFDVLTIGHNRLAICIADVVGKGVSAALLMANVQATVRAFARDSASPAWVCSRVNSVLCGNIASDKFVTFFYAVLDADARALQYCNAGHPYPILMSSGSLRQLDQGGAVLGVFPAWTYEESTIELSPGDRLFLFTDGITEAAGPGGQEFGVESIAAFARAHPTNSASALNSLLLAEVTDFCGAKFQDDATLLVLAVN
jgi:phosphoserine phosphatase RsbU/P